VVQRKILRITHITKFFFNFLKDHTQSNTSIKEKYKVKKQSCLNLDNSEQTLHNYKVENNQLINHNYKKSVSLQIPQKNTRLQLLADANHPLIQPFQKQIKKNQ
jgi:hypothetical protein